VLHLSNHEIAYSQRFPKHESHSTFFLPCPRPPCHSHVSSSSGAPARQPARRLPCYPISLATSHAPDLLLPSPVPCSATAPPTVVVPCPVTPAPPISNHSTLSGGACSSHLQPGPCSSSLGSQHFVLDLQHKKVEESLLFVSCVLFAILLHVALEV
jgi:hypothetical protein